MTIHNPHRRILIDLPLALMLILMSFGFASPAFAATESSGGEYVFVFRPQHGVKLPDFAARKSNFQFRTSAESYEKAFLAASKACYQYFKGGHPLDEEAGLAIIDVCANPRGS